MSAIPDSKEAVEQHRSLYYHRLKPNMGRIRHAQELAERMHQRKHMVQQAGAAEGAAIGVPMCEAAAVSEGPSPYYAPGISTPYDGFSTKEPPQGLQTRGFKRALEYSGIADSPTKSRAKKMETIIFASHPIMQQTLLQAVEKSTQEAQQIFEARLTKAYFELGQSPQPEAAAVPDTGGKSEGSASSGTP
eukprot:6540925-Karenia_brevis.AAC.1